MLENQNLYSIININGYIYNKWISLELNVHCLDDNYSVTHWLL